MRRQLDGNGRHPVELLADGQAVEHAADAFADRPFELRKVRGRDNGAYGLPLSVMLRRVHGDEVGQVDRTFAAAFLDAIFDDDAAESGFRGEHLMVRIDRHDVLVLRDRPIRSIGAVGAEMHRVFAPQPGKIGALQIALVKLGPAYVDLVQG